MGRSNHLYAGRRNEPDEVYGFCFCIDHSDAASDRKSIDLADAGIALIKKEVYEREIRKECFYKNKRATFDYELLDTYTAGIVLTGTEIKSIRQGKASLVDTFCIIDKGELWVKNMYIAEYFYGTYNNHSARRDRKLLLQKKELRKIAGAVKASGFTIVPTRLFINDKGLAKLIVAIARGKKEYDKRDSIKERDDKREMARAFRH